MSIAMQTTVGKIATEHPLATRVFARHRIDFCCGGGKPLGEVCQLKDLDVDTILDEIQKEIETSDTSEIQWDTAALPDLIDHILATYHRPLDEELPRLEAMARKVHAVHLDKAPETLSSLLSVYLGLKEELDQHMVKEELDLFPMIKQGKGKEVGAPVCVMLHEHDTAAHALARLRELTDDYQVPEDACNTWRALWHGLAALETSLHEHIHLENNILFPRALKG